MRDRFNRFMYGRHGMDELSKALFWCGLVLLLLSFAVSMGIRFLGTLMNLFGTFALVFSLVRAFSRNSPQREAENLLFLRWLGKKKAERQSAKNRRAQRKDFKFFRCPGCSTWVRVPRGKGKIHINCRCGYTLYRKT